MKKRVKNSINISIFILSFIYLGSLSFLLFQHSNMLSMTTDRMHPSIPKGSLLFYQAIEPRSLQINDIILFTTQDKSYSISRIVGAINTKDDLFFRTKSDATSHLDFDFRNQTDIRGIITRQIPYVGYVIDYSKSFAGKLLLVTPLIVLLTVIFILNRHNILPYDKKQGYGLKR